MHPQQELNFLRPAFLDLFKDEKPDLARFIRLVIDVLDCNAGYGPHKCNGDGMLHPKGCGEVSKFKVFIDEDRGGIPVGAQCQKCGAVYLFAFTKGLKTSSKRAVITSNGRTVGQCRSESDSGVVIIDTSPVTVEIKEN